MFQNYYGNISCEKRSPALPPASNEDLSNVEALAKRWDEDLAWGAELVSPPECVLNAQSVRQVASFCSPELVELNGRTNPSVSGVVFENGYFPYVSPTRQPTHYHPGNPRTSKNF